MENFSDAAQSSEQALKNLDQTASSRLTEIRFKRAIESKNAAGERVLVRPDANFDCGFEASGCVLRLKTREQDQSQKKGEPPTGEALVVTSLLPNQLAAAGEISLYSEGLKAIAAADNTQDVRDGVESAMSGVCGLAGSLSSFAGASLVAAPACDAFRVPVASLAAFLYGEYQAQAKLSALRDATSQMQPVLDQAADIFSTSSKFAIDGDVRRLSEAYAAASADWEGPDKTEAKLKALLDAAARLDAVLKARAELGSDDSVFRAFAVVHSKMTDTLRLQKPDLASMFGEIERLKDKAQNFADIAKEFKEAIDTARNLEANP